MTTPPARSCYGDDDGGGGSSSGARWHKAFLFYVVELDRCCGWSVGGVLDLVICYSRKMLSLN